jgi:hypothetical protein
LVAQKKPVVKVSLVIVKGLLTMPKAQASGSGGGDSVRGTPDLSGYNAAVMRPSGPQRRYLERGLTQAGGKLPLFDRDGRQVPRRTVESCVFHGWAAPWANNPIKPDWLVCRLTVAGYRALGVAPPPGISMQPAELPPVSRN